VGYSQPGFSHRGRQDPLPLKKVLIISPHFPPINAPDMQRVRMSLPYYRALGWEPIVLCVGEAWQDGVREPELEQTIPSDVRVVRVPALPLRWTRFIGIRNIRLRCWLHFRSPGPAPHRRGNPLKCPFCGFGCTYDSS